MEDEIMDVEEDIFAGVQLPYEGSGSEYENSEEDTAKTQTEKAKTTSKSRGGSLLESKRKSGSQRATKLLGSHREAGPKRQRDEARQEEGIDSSSDGQVPRDNVQSQHIDSTEPSGNTVKLPLREIAKNNLKRKDSPVIIEGDEPKKRWKKASNPKYISLLNIDIKDAVARTISDDKIILEGSQIGSSIWTVSEKDEFFNAISRLGRDNVKEISARISTKSELEVQEYMQLLHTEFTKRRIEGRILELPDFPAAFEISEECSEGLETAADKLASLQEKSEIEVEREKWGDSWLLTPEVSHWLNKRRNQNGGKKAIDEVLPAANLFNLDKWLELSDRVFMNPSESEDNWQSLGDVPPSIRATAFEDFHSLAVFITKKLVSTTLYCTMSRERATQAQKTKHADVTPADVEAAVNILNLTHNGDNFWKKSARRCNLQVLDEDDTTVLSYADVEAELSSMPHRRRSRSRSTSRPPRGAGILPSSEETSTGDVESADDLFVESEDEESMSFSDTERSKIARAREAKVQAMEAYTESLDQQRSREEEVRLWKMLGKVPAERLKDEEEELVRPKRLVNVFEEQLGWREHVKYRSEWEVMDGVVEEEDFERNRNRVVKHRRRIRNRATGRDEGPRGELSTEFVDGDEEDLMCVEDEGGSGSEGEEEMSLSRNEISDQEQILGSIEEDEEIVSERAGRSIHNDHEDGDESMVEEARHSEDILGEREFTNTANHPEEEDNDDEEEEEEEEEKGNDE